MRLQSFISESKEGRTKVVNMDEAAQIIKKNCRKAWRRFTEDKQGLFRGHVSIRSDFGYVEPSKFNRKSANTDNHYTLWIDNSKQWSKFPKRSQSLICSSSLDGAYGTMDERYLVLPYDNSSIGLCPASDFWDSFKGYYTTIADVNYELSELYNRLIGEKKYIAKDWNTLRDSVMRIDEMWANMNSDARIEFFNKTSNQLLTYMVDHDKSCSEMLNEILKPYKFKLIVAGGALPKNDDRECWTDGNSILVGYDIYTSVVKTKLLDEMINE